MSHLPGPTATIFVPTYFSVASGSDSTLVVCGNTVFTLVVCGNTVFTLVVCGNTVVPPAQTPHLRAAACGPKRVDLQAVGLCMLRVQVQLRI